MISEDFAIELITSIKKHSWAIETFHELEHDFDELNLTFNLTQFIRQCKPMINQPASLVMLGRLLRQLDDKKTRDEYLNAHTDIENSCPMNPGLLCVIIMTITMAGQGPDKPFKDAYTQVFKNTHARFITHWREGTADLLPIFIPIPFTPLRNSNNKSNDQKHDISLPFRHILK